jgi:hypothetical protein
MNEPGLIRYESWKDFREGRRGDCLGLPAVYAFRYEHWFFMCEYYAIKRKICLN